MTASLAVNSRMISPHVAPGGVGYPDIDIRLMLTDRNVNLVEEHLDFAFRIGDLADSALKATRIGSTRYITCASPSYIKTHGEPKNLRELSRHGCITFEGLSTPSSTTWSFQEGTKTHAVTVRSRLAVSTVDAAIEACLRGLGVARVLEYPILDHLKSGALKPLLLKHEPPAKPIHLLYHNTSVLPLKMRAFMDFAVPRLKHRLNSTA